MCLITDWDKSRIAEEDITCYKWYGMSNSAYISPYQGKPIPSFDTKVYSDLSEPKIINDFDKCIYELFYVLIPGRYRVEKGFHSFVNSIDAKLYSYKGRDSIVVSCIIPKGAKYYKGFFENCESYCSDSIILKKEICV